MASVFCRGCGKQIEEAASFCPHCGASQHSQGEAVVPSVTMNKPVADYGMVLLAIPAIASVVIWSVVSGMALYQSPAEILTLIMWITIIGTASVAAMEASKLGMTSDRQKGTYRPAAWFLILALLWVVGYPAYLYKRKQYGLKNHLIPGLLVMLLFIGSWGYTSESIEAKRQDIADSLGMEMSEAQPAATTTPAENAPVSHKGDDAFNCADNMESLKSVDENIIAVEQIRPLTQEEADAAKVYQMVKGGLQEALGQGSPSGQYVLSQKIPGKIIGTCVGDTFYNDGNSRMSIFTVSTSSNGSNYVSIQEYAEMQGALLMYRAGKARHDAEAKEKAALQQIPLDQESTKEGSSQPGTHQEQAEPMKTALETAGEPIKPSFNCNKATSPVEKMICQSPELAKWDTRLAESFNDRYSHASPQEKLELATSQKEWIKKRNQCDSNKCIADVYEQRDQELVPWEYEQHE